MGSSAATSTSALRISENGRRSLSEEVYNYLTGHIIQGEIRYGDRLNIKEMARRLEVSPMPIREALMRLEVEGIVTITPRSHCSVRIPTKRQILDAVDARIMLEVTAVSSVVATVSPDRLASLDEILEEMSVIVNQAEPRLAEYIDLDRRFHTELCRLAENEYIDGFYRHINMHLSMSYRYGGGSCHGADATFEEHRRILELLRINSPGAVEVLERHLHKSRSNIQQEPTFLSLPD